MEILLTIAIPTINRRKLLFDELYNELKRQSEPYGNQIEIISVTDDEKITIGEKRNQLNELAQGKYIVQWDDDDWICEGGIDMIMEGIKTDSDVITYNHYSNIEEWGELKHFHKYCTLAYTPPNGTIDYENAIMKYTPDQKCVIKSEIAKRIKFYHMTHGEDSYYMRDILPF